MAQKRMFDKKVVESDKFLDLPNSSKALYFMAGMEADDKGFFQPRKLQRMCGFSDDDYKILIAKGFFITFESGVMVVTDWNKNNWLDNRRITETEYVDELNMLNLINQRYEIKEENIVAKPMLSQYSIEENSIEENSSSNSLSNIVNFYENNINLITPFEYEKLQDYIEMDEDLIIYAMQKAVTANARNFNYINTILKSWKAKGIKTLIQAKNEDQQFRKGKQQKNETDEERIKRLTREMEERMKYEN